MADRARFYFDSYQAAAGGILAVLLDARDTKSDYSFTGLTAQDVLTAGLLLEGDIEEVAAKVAALPGVLRQVE